MKLKTAFVILLWLAAAIAPSYAAAQAPAAGTFPPCIPAGQPAAPAGGGRGEGGTGQAQQRVPRDVAITAIPGVVAASAKWTKVWQGAGNSADGIVADRDGNMLIAQEDYDAVLKIDKNGKASVHISNAKGVGSLSMDRQGRLYGVHRTERPGSTKALFVTNGGTVVHFDVRGPGMLANRRDFATLETGNGDGLAVDAEGRLYVTTNPGVQVFDKSGKYLGLIPTPRGVISVAFGGPGKKTLYVVGSGAEDATGQPIREGPQQTAATVYKLPMIAEGVKGRAK